MENRPPKRDKTTFEGASVLDSYHKGAKTVENIVANLISFLSGFAAAVFGEPLRRRIFRAKLQLDFGQSNHFITRAYIRGEGMEEQEARYIRIRVRNIKPLLARSCRAFLVNIEKQNEEGVFEETEYYDSLQLEWSAGEGFDKIDLEYGIDKYIALLHTRSDSDILHLNTQFNSYSLAENLLGQTGTFRFTILGSGDGIDPQVVRIVFSWRGQWDTFAVHKE